VILQAGADVNFINPNGPTVLTFASRRGLTDIVKFLLEAGADPNIPGDEVSMGLTMLALSVFILL
jgi:ankyrin repeat protein